MTGNHLSPSSGIVPAVAATKERIAVYEYGCLRPLSGEQEMLDQMHRRNRLWNALVEIEREHRSKVVSLLSDESAQLHMDELTAQIKAARAEIGLRRKAARKRSVDLGVLPQQLEQLMAERRIAINEAREKRRAALAGRRTELEVLEQNRRLAVKLVRQGSGLYWGNYDEVLASYTQARIRMMKTGGELRFRRWDGSGKVTVRYQQGLACQDLFGADTRLQVAAVDPQAWSSPQRSVRRKLAQTKIRIRVGSDGRAPVWLVLPLVMHRPLPAGSQIRCASVIRERVGFHYRHRLVITVRLPIDHQAVEGSAIAVELGWRSLPHGLRVAFAVDEEDRNYELALPTSLVEQFRKVYDLKSIRDRQFNEVRAMLCEWLKVAAFPDWFREQTANMALWHSPERLDVLVRKWGDNHFSGDEEIYDKSKAWQGRYRHLRLYEDNLRDQLSRHRRELFRLWTSRLVKEHSRIFLKRFDLRGVVRKAPPESPRPSSYSGGVRTIAAPSVLRNIIRHTASRLGRELIETDAKYTTRECHVCGSMTEWDSAKMVVHRCDHCESTWDQDRNAAILILRSGLVGTKEARRDDSAVATDIVG